MTNTKTGKSAKRHRPIYIIIAVITLLVILEFSFHIFEMMVGRLLLATNSSRPQIGRLWEEEQKDLSGNVAIDSLVQQAGTDSISLHHFASFYDLHSELMLSKRIMMGRNDFLNFYLSIPTKTAKILFDPMHLLEIKHDDIWTTVELVLDGNQLGIFFRDGFNNALREDYIDVNKLTQDSKKQMQTTLETMPEYKGRTIPANIFYNAYMALPVLQRLQVMNDPYTLLYWGDNLYRVGIGSRVTMGSVSLAFQVVSDYKLRVHTVNASAIAVEYLINNINKISETQPISIPR